MSRSARRFAFVSSTALAAAALLVAGCTTPPAPVTVSDVVQATAVVEAIDPATRRVRLKGADGRSMMVQASPSVQNFQQVKVGDRVTVRYTEAVAAEVVKPGTGVTTSAATTTTDRAAAGERPRASETVTLKGVVKVTSVDTVNNTVDIVGYDGAARKIRVADPKAREFIRGLKSGDEVQLTFTEAVAVSVEPAR
jgi:Cu/Ag efflux protein CusF